MHFAFDFGIPSPLISLSLPKKTPVAETTATELGAKKTAAKKTAAKKTAGKKTATRKITAKKATRSTGTRKATGAPRAVGRGRTSTTARDEVLSAISQQLRQQMVRAEAYYAAERDGFRGDPVQYWLQAEATILRQLQRSP